MKAKGNEEKQGHKEEEKESQRKGMVTEEIKSKIWTDKNFQFDTPRFVLMLASIIRMNFKQMRDLLTTKLHLESYEIRTVWYCRELKCWILMMKYKAILRTRMIWDERFRMMRVEDMKLIEKELRGMIEYCLKNEYIKNKKKLYKAHHVLYVLLKDEECENKEELIRNLFRSC